RRANLFKYATLILLAVMSARVYCADAFPRPRLKLPLPPLLLSGSPRRWRLPVFDGTGSSVRLPPAGSGRAKTSETRLSRPKALNFLRFDTLTSERGSIFTRDVDNDGDNDLIWSDLLHPDDVVVWLDDGGGRFERVCPQQFAQSFVLSGAGAFDGFEIPHSDLASSPRHDPLFALLPARMLDRSISGRSPNRGFRQSFARACVLRLPSDRGPPSIG